MKKYLPLLALILFAGCKKSDNTAPVVNIISPTDGLVAASGQTITVKADISDETGLHMVHCIVTDNTGGHYIHLEEHLDAKSYSLNKTFVVQAGKVYTIEVSATDHGDNLTDKILTVTGN